MVKLGKYCNFLPGLWFIHEYLLTLSALKIHCSPQCKEVLDQLGGYYVEERGLVAMKVSSENPALSPSIILTIRLSQSPWSLNEKTKM